MRHGICLGTNHKNTYIYKIKIGKLANYVKTDTCFLKNKPCEPLSKIPELKVINKTISDIPDDKFRVSFGLYLSGYDYEEITGIMNLSLHEVEYSIRFVKEKLLSGR